MENLRREVREINSTAEWLSWRENVMTASRVPALFKLEDGTSAHPYMTRDALAAEMRGRSRGSNAAMRRGRILEPAVAAAVAEERPDWLVRKANTFHLLPDHRLGATPDYFAQEAFAEVGEGFLNIQCKTVNEDEWNKWRGKPPLGYLLQTACENLVTDASAGVLAIMVTSRSFPLFLFDVPRHEAAEQRILDAVVGWWCAWDSGEIAAPAPLEDIAEALDDGSYRDLSADNMMPGLLAERAELKAAVSASERRLKDIDYDIKNRIGAAHTAYVPGWSITFATQKRKETTIPASAIRVLRVKAIAEESE
jgi:predicted phage-related endonuclease